MGGGGERFLHAAGSRADNTIVARREKQVHATKTTTITKRIYLCAYPRLTDVRGVPTKILSSSIDSFIAKKFLIVPFIIKPS
jgi:hypothetical protein